MFPVGWGFREFVNEELELFYEKAKKSRGGGGGGPVEGQGVVRVDVYEELKL